MAKREKVKEVELEMEFHPGSQIYYPRLPDRGPRYPINLHPKKFFKSWWFWIDIIILIIFLVSLFIHLFG